MLGDRVYFADGAGAQRPKYVTRAGAALTHRPAHGGPAGELVLASTRTGCSWPGDPAQPQRIYFSELETERVEPARQPGTRSPTGLRRVRVTGLWPMGAQILVFHDGSIEKLRGSIPPGTDRRHDDMWLDPFTEQMGCNDPASIVGWQENVIWAAPRGVYLSDGSTIRSLTEQGGIGDLWRTLYANKRPGTQVVAAVFLDLLFVSVLTDWTADTPHRPAPLHARLRPERALLVSLRERGHDRRDPLQRWTGRRSGGARTGSTTPPRYS